MASKRRPKQSMTTTAITVLIQLRQRKKFLTLGMIHLLAAKCEITKNFQRGRHILLISDATWSISEYPEESEILKKKPLKFKISSI